MVYLPEANSCRRGALLLIFCRPPVMFTVPSVKYKTETSIGNLKRKEKQMQKNSQALDGYFRTVKKILNK
jgi:hypothetical protein